MTNDSLNEITKLVGAAFTASSEVDVRDYLRHALDCLADLRYGITTPDRSHASLIEALEAAGCHYGAHIVREHFSRGIPEEKKP